MMNGHEKSDPVVVAVNAPNKAGRAAAEARERRAGTEGKAGQHGTPRALNRERVSQALDRLRQAAKQRKKERFTALLRHVNPDSLRQAFLALKRDAAPGVDGMTWREYEAELEPPARRPARPYSSRRVSPAALAPDVYTEGGWLRAAAGHCRPGRQDRPGRHRHGAECDIRGGLPRVLVRVPTRTGTARRARRLGGRDHQPEGELDIGRRHPVVLGPCCIMPPGS